MDLNKFNIYLKERYEPEVEWYDKKSTKNKKITYVLKLLTICLSSIVPVIAALQFVNNGIISLTIIVSSVVAISTGIMSFGKFEELWHSYRTTCETLRKELNYYNCQCGEYYKIEDPERLFVERVESLISKENTEWVAMIKENKQKENTNT